MMGVSTTTAGELVVVKVGGEFVVNQVTAGDQNDSSVTGLTNGNFAVSYTDVTTSGANVNVRLFNEFGIAIAEYVEPQLTTSQSQSSVTALADGKYIVIYSGVVDLYQNEIYAQVFNADGTTSGSSFLVNTTLRGQQSLPKITDLEGGGFVATWANSEFVSFQTLYTFRAQIFDADGNTVGGEIAVNSPSSTQVPNEATAVASLTGGGFVVAWRDYAATSGVAGDTSETGVFAQVYAANGTTIGSAFLVNTQTDLDQAQPVITGLAGGGFVVAWVDTSELGDGNNFSIQAQIYDANGLKVGTEFLVNTTTDGVQFQPAISSLEDGGFVIAWTDYSQTGGDISGGSVRAQAYDAGGDKVGKEVLVNTQTTGFQRDSAITGLANGNFAVTWTDEGPNSDGDGTSVKGQIFAFNHEPVIDSYNGGDSAAVSITENDIFAATVTATDADTGTKLTYSVGGDDASKFTINSAGQLNFKIGPNFEAPGDVGANNVYDVVVTVSDGLSTDTQAIAVTVEDAPERPIITSDGGGPEATVSLPENSLLVTTVEASDDDLNTTLTYSILSGPDQEKFTIDANTGELSFINAPDFEDSTADAKDGVYTVTVKVTDGKLADAQEISITVTDVVNELLLGTSDADTLTGSDGDDRIYAGAGDDTLIGKGGNDRLYGGVGGDTMSGGAGNDRYTVGSIRDVVIELADEGIDTVLSTINYTLGDNVENLRAQGTNGLSLNGNALDNWIIGGIGNDVISGRDGSDHLSGGGGIDTLNGEGGDDALTGGAGDDTLVGGSGRDRLAGGAGADSFVFTTLGQGAADLDRIEDFSVKQGDRINLFRSGFAGLGAGVLLDAGAFYAAAGARGGHDADDRIIFDTSTGKLYFDADGNGSGVGVLFALLRGVGADGLSASDFLILG